MNKWGVCACDAVGGERPGLTERQEMRLGKLTEARL